MSKNNRHFLPIYHGIYPPMGRKDATPHDSVKPNFKRGPKLKKFKIFMQIMFYRSFCLF